MHHSVQNKPAMVAVNPNSPYKYMDIAHTNRKHGPYKYPRTAYVTSGTLNKAKSSTPQDPAMHRTSDTQQDATTPRQCRTASKRQDRLAGTPDTSSRRDKCAPGHVIKTGQVRPRTRHQDGTSAPRVRTPERRTAALPAQTLIVRWPVVVVCQREPHVGTAHVLQDRLRGAAGTLRGGLGPAGVDETECYTLMGVGDVAGGLTGSLEDDG